MFWVWRGSQALCFVCVQPFALDETSEGPTFRCFKLNLPCLLHPFCYNHTPMHAYTLQATAAGSTTAAETS